MLHSPWQGKTVVICGASAGLGREFALVLAELRISKLALVSRSLDALLALRHELLTQHTDLQVLCLAADVCRQEQLRPVVQQIKDKWGGVDLLIQAVGQSDRGRLLDLTPSRLHELIELNVVSSLNALQCFDSIIQQPGGSIVLIGSLASKLAPRFLGGYAIAKHGLAALAQQARLELGERGIHVLLACPGPILRVDAGTRYSKLAGSPQLPDSALQPGGGAKVRGLDARLLVQQILAATARKTPQLIRPSRAEWLIRLSAVSCRWGEWLLRKNSG